MPGSSRAIFSKSSLRNYMELREKDCELFVEKRSNGPSQSHARTKVLQAMASARGSS